MRQHWATLGTDIIPRMMWNAALSKWTKNINVQISVDNFLLINVLSSKPCEIYIFIYGRNILFTFNSQWLSAPPHIWESWIMRVQLGTFFIFSWSLCYIKIYLHVYVKGERCNWAHIYMYLFKSCRSPVGLPHYYKLMLLI